MEVLVAFIAFFAMVFGVMYMFYTTRNKERMALIEKGADASLFNTGKGAGGFINWNKFTLKVGMLAVGIAVGILSAAILKQTSSIDEDSLYSSLIFLFGGLSLVVFYVIDRRAK